MSDGKFRLINNENDSSKFSCPRGIRTFVSFRTFEFRVQSSPLSHEHLCAIDNNQKRRFPSQNWPSWRPIAIAIPTKLPRLGLILSRRAKFELHGSELELRTSGGQIWRHTNSWLSLVVRLWLLVCLFVSLSVILESNKSNLCLLRPTFLLVELPPHKSRPAASLCDQMYQNGICRLAGDKLRLPSEQLRTNKQESASWQIKISSEAAKWGDFFGSIDRNVARLACLLFLVCLCLFARSSRMKNSTVNVLCAKVRIRRHKSSSNSSKASN